MKSSEQVIEIINQIEKTIIGKREILELTMITLLSEGHLLLEDVPGVGKTTLAKTIAGTLGCKFSRIQFTPDTLPGDVVGTSIYNMQTGKFEYMQGAVMSQIVLADEINRTSPKTQASLLEAMEEAQVTVDGKTYKLEKPFMVIATENPIDYLGTYHLPEAQLDRFFMKLSIGYPALKEEKKLIQCFLGNKEWKEFVEVGSSNEICRMQEEVKQVTIKEDLIDYILKIVEETRKHEQLRLGTSPRGALALTRGAQATAYLYGRDYVIPDDIKKIVKPVLSHRLILTAEAKSGKMTTEKILASIMTTVRVPV